MQIHVAHNGEKFGPYSPDEVRARLTAGQFSPNDLAWYDGLAQWTSLGAVMNTLPAAANVPPPVPVDLTRPKSGLAKASFIISLVTLGVWIVVFTLAAISFAGGTHTEHQQLPNPLMLLAGLGMLLNILLSLIGTIFGLIVVFKPISNKWMAIVGVIVNGIEFIGMAILMIVSIVLTNSHSL